MDEFDLYGDLELLHAQEKEAASEDLKWKDKYAVALGTIQKLQAEKKELNKKVKQLETNFASLFDTARAEIKRKDNEILKIRKQRDDICFRRIKPQNVERQFTENADVRKAASSEGLHVNPFSGQPIKKSEKNSDDKLPLTFENDKRKFDKANYCKERDSKNVPLEKDQSRHRHRDRSKDNSRHRNRSRDRVDERSRHRFDDRNEKKHRDRLEHRKGSTSKERSNHRDDRNYDKKRKRRSRNTSQTRSLDSSWDKNDKIHSDYEQTNEEQNKGSYNRYEPTKLEDKPRDMCKSNSDYTKDQTQDLNTELNELVNIPGPLNENRINPKIEILQIEILKDVKELKKKLKADKMPKPDPIDPAKVAIEKSNQFLDALFDDSIMNKSKERNDDLYDQQTDSISDDNKTENHKKKDEKCNLNFQTPQRQSITKNFDDLFGPSPAGSMCSVVVRQNSKSLCESSSDSDFVPIMKPAKSQKDEIAATPKVPIVIDDKESFKMKPPKNPVTVGINALEKNETGKSDDDDLLVAFKQTDLNVDKKKYAKTDENFNLKHQTPQKQLQLAKTLLDDLFGPSPGGSIGGQENSVTSMDESSSNLYFEPVIKSVSSRIDDKTQAPTPSKIPIVIDDSSSDNDITNNEKNVTENIVNDAKTFKFTEFDSSFYSSEDEINDDLKEALNTSKVEVESPPFEIITPSKNIQAFETESTKSSNIGEKSLILNKSDEKLLKLNCEQASNEENTEEKCRRETFKNKIVTDDFEKTCKPSFPDNQTQSERNKEGEEFCKKDEPKKRPSKQKITSYNSKSMSPSEENQHRSSTSRSEKEKHHRHLHHHHHHHHHHHKHRSKESTHTKSDTSSHKSSRKHSRVSHKIETKCRYSKDKSALIALKTDDEPVKDLSRNQNVAYRDQIFFLHCDDISDDDEIIGEQYKIGSNDDGGQNLNRNVLEIESPDVSSFEKNKIEINKKSNESEITNEMELNKRDIVAFESSESIIPLIHENTAEIDMETECNVLSKKAEPQEKDLTLGYNLKVATEASCSRIDENPTNAVSSDLEKKDAIMCDINLAVNKTNKSTNLNASGYINTTTGISSQQFSEEYPLQNFKNNSEKENNCIEIQSNDNVQIDMVNLDDSIENEKSEVLTSANKDEKFDRENLNKVVLHERSQDIPSLSSLEVDSIDQQKHKIEENDQLTNSIHSYQLSSHHVELNINTKMSNKEQSITEENDVFNGDKIEMKNDNTSCNNVNTKNDFENILNNENSISDEKLETSLEKDTNFENLPDCQMVIREAIKPSYDEFSEQQSTPSNQKHCDTNSHGITYQNSNKLPETSPNKILVNLETKGNEELISQITEIIPVCSTNEVVSASVTDQNLSHSNELFSSHVSLQKLLNSGDELESSHSSSDIVLSGRRKKIKTPRKHTHVCKHASNKTMTMVSDRYTKCDEVQTSILIQSESNLKSSDIPTKLISPDKDLKDTRRFKFKKKTESHDNKITSEELNNRSENGKDIATDKMPEEEQKSIDEYKLEFASKESRKDLIKPKKAESSLSSSHSEEFSKQVEKEGHNTEEPALSLSKTKEIPLFFPSNTLLNKDQQKSNYQIDEDCIETFLPSRTTSEDQVTNIEDVSSIGLGKTKKLQQQAEMLEKDPSLKVVSSQTGNFLASCELKGVKNTEYEKKEKSVGSYSITIKRNRNKKKNIKNSAEVIETMSNEVVNDTNKTPFLGESLDQTHNLNIEEKHTNEITGFSSNHDFMEKSNNETSDTTCSSSFVNNHTFKSSTLTSNDTNQHQMIKHFMDSEHMLVGTCNYQADEVTVDTKPKETNVKKRKCKSNMSPDNSGCELKNKETESSPTCEVKKVHVKRKYKKKTTQILDSSKSNEDVEVNNSSISEELKVVPNDDDKNQKKSKAMEHFKSPDSKDLTKERKHNRKKSNSSFDSTNKSNELHECIEDDEKPSSTSQLDSSRFSERNIEKLHSLQPTGEIVDEVLNSSNETTNLCLEKSSTNFPEENLEVFCDNTKVNNAIDCCLNSSISTEEKEHDSNIVKHKKAKKQRKRKLSRSSDAKSEEAIVQPKKPKNTFESSSQSLINTCDTTSCPASDKNHCESMKQLQRSPSHEKSISIELTPTHHKIFLNDDFPKDLPPVYNANDDDLQYHEIDDRLRCMFQSPSYTQQSNGECTFDNKNDATDSISKENVQVDKTLNQSDTTPFDTSTSLRKVSVGSNEYVIESIGSHTANVFITRKKCKKRTKVVTTKV